MPRRREPEELGACSSQLLEVVYGVEWGSASHREATLLHLEYLCLDRLGHRAERRVTGCGIAARRSAEIRAWLGDDSSGRGACPGRQGNARQSAYATTMAPKRRGTTTGGTNHEAMASFFLIGRRERWSLSAADARDAAGGNTHMVRHHAIANLGMGRVKEVSSLRRSDTGPLQPRTIDPKGSVLCGFVTPS